MRTVFVFTLIIATMLMMTGLAQAQEAKPAQPSIAFGESALWGGTFFDLGTTLMGLKFNRVEANPVLNNPLTAALNTQIERINAEVGKNHPAESAIVLGTSFAVHLQMRYLRSHGHPKLANTVGLFVGAVHLGAGGLNLRH